MNAKRFLDTNILLYAYDLGSSEKRSIALKIVEEGWNSPGETAISVQVLQELHVNLTSKKVPKLVASQIVRDFSAWPVVENSMQILVSALDEQIRWQTSLWDAIILAAARSSGASELLTEDFNHGQNYGGGRAINPFK